ncbi:hypothetical protein M0R19_02300 [Candidatus Pacearchaeota archaeon]|nr:hypothetical protein [Candidatus Pacearchaeota archaeon]
MINLQPLKILARITRKDSINYLDLSTHKKIDSKDVDILPGSMQIVFNKNKPEILVNVSNGANAFLLEKQVSYDIYNPVYKVLYCRIKN